MIAFRVFPETELIEKYDLIKHPKFYYFDVGVLNGLERNFDPSQSRLRELSEQVVYQQLIHSASALRKNLKVHTLRARGGVEIDFWIKLESKMFGIEVKSNDQLIDDDVRHLVHFKKNEPQGNYYLFHFGKNEIKKNGIWCLPAAAGFKEIGL